jgi:hypothetical protein
MMVDGSLQLGIRTLRPGHIEFGVIGRKAGVNRFIMFVEQWIERTKAIGLLVKAGR